MFLQSNEWQNILKSEGKDTEKLHLPSGQDIFLIYQKIFGVKYVFCPGGPFKLEPEDAKFIFDYLKNKNCIFFRFEPSEKIPDVKYQIRKTIDITPRATTVLDLTKTEDNLLEAMHEKTRYNIRLAEKKSLRLATGKDEKVFLELMKETAGRDKFSLHDAEHYRAILNSPLSRQFTLFTTEGAPAATGIWIGFGKVFTYLFGASNYKERSLMAPQLIQWEAIKIAKKLGFEEYDFFGIAPNCHPDRASATSERRDLSTSLRFARDDKYEYDKRHQYAGVTRFKVNFGGKTLEKPGTFDLIISPMKYRIYGMLRKLRRLI